MNLAPTSATTAPTESLAGLVECVTFNNKENGSCVLWVTRGKRLVVLVGQRKAIALAVRNGGQRRRWSKLGEWLSAA